MRSRTRHRRTAAVACWLFARMLRMYPAEFRRTYGEDVAITFRNRVEDVLNDGGILNWGAFVARTVVDEMRACAALLSESRLHHTDEFLAAGANRPWLEATATDRGMAFVSGVALSCAGCYAFILVLLSYAR